MNISKLILGVGYGCDAGREERGLIGCKLWSIWTASVRVLLTTIHLELGQGPD